MSEKYNIASVTEIIAKQMEVYKLPFEKIWDEYVPEDIKSEFNKGEVFDFLKSEHDELFLSPLPWKINFQEILDSNENQVAQFNKDVDIEYTRKCINMHNELINIIKDFKFFHETGTTDLDKEELSKKIEDILNKDRETNFEYME